MPNLIEISDILGLSKPMTKLIEVISQGLGKVYEPYLIKKIADAKAYELKTMAEAISENPGSLNNLKYKDGKISLALLNKDNINKKSPLLERSEEREKYQNLIKQFNIENITQIAAEQLELDVDVSDEKVNDDWARRFFKYSEDVSDKDMQSIWGRILAGEVKSPNSYSLRTLDIVKNLSQSEAEAFAKVGNSVIFVEHDAIIFVDMNGSDMKSFNISPKYCFLLADAGLLNFDETNKYSMPQIASPSYQIFKVGKKELVVNREANTPELEFKTFRFTTAGKELLKLIEINPNEKYVQMFMEFMGNSNSHVELRNVEKI